MDQGETLINDVEMTSTLRSEADYSVVLGVSDLDAGDSLTLPFGPVLLTIYAVNGDVCDPQPCNPSVREMVIIISEKKRR